MIDKLTIYQGKYNKTLLGSYYATKPLTVKDVGVPFDYEILDPWAKEQDTINNLGVSKYRTMAIKTNDPLEWSTSGYVSLQEGGLFQITSIRQDLGNVSKQAYRNLRYTLGGEYVLNLVEVENPTKL